MARLAHGTRSPHRVEPSRPPPIGGRRLPMTSFWPGDQWQGRRAFYRHSSPADAPQRKRRSAKTRYDRKQNSVTDGGVALWRRRRRRRRSLERPVVGRWPPVAVRSRPPKGLRPLVRSSGSAPLPFSSSTSAWLFFFVFLRLSLVFFFVFRVFVLCASPSYGVRAGATSASFGAVRPSAMVEKRAPALNGADSVAENVRTKNKVRLPFAWPLALPHWSLVDQSESRALWSPRKPIRCVGVCHRLDFGHFYRVLPGFTGFYRVLLGFTGFYLVLLGFTGFYRVSLCSAGGTGPKRKEKARLRVSNFRRTAVAPSAAARETPSVPSPSPCSSSASVGSCTSSPVGPRPRSHLHNFSIGPSAILFFSFLLIFFFWKPLDCFWLLLRGS